MLHNFLPLPVYTHMQYCQCIQQSARYLSSRPKANPLPWLWPRPCLHRSPRCCHAIHLRPLLRLQHNKYDICTVSRLMWKTGGGQRKFSLTTQTPLILYHLTVTQSLQTFVARWNVDTCWREFLLFLPAQSLLRGCFLVGGRNEEL